MHRGHHVTDEKINSRYPSVNHVASLFFLFTGSGFSVKGEKVSGCVGVDTHIAYMFFFSRRLGNMAGRLSKYNAGCTPPIGWSHSQSKLGTMLKWLYLIAPTWQRRLTVQSLNSPCQRFLCASSGDWERHSTVPWVYRSFSGVEQSSEYFRH